jgi:hypothetical protein
MTESEWRTAFEPHAMLEFLQKNGKVTDRKLRLFAVACSRRVWDLIDALGRAAVEAAETFADGLVGPEEMRAARLACQGAGGQSAWYASASNPAIAARNAARSAQSGVKAQIGSDTQQLLAQAELVREIFGSSLGNSFHPATIDSAWPAWNGGPAAKIAQAIYDERAFERMTILADALEKAGCDNEEMLSHLRGPGPHVRGCWVLDLILGKA